jgi:hypothetical protein
MSKRSAGPQAQAIAGALHTKIEEAQGKAEALTTAGENHASTRPFPQNSMLDRFITEYVPCSNLARRLHR